MSALLSFLIPKAKFVIPNPADPQMQGRFQRANRRKSCQIYSKFYACCQSMTLAKGLMIATGIVACVNNV